MNEALADAYALLKSGTLWHNTQLASPKHPCKGFADANPGEAALIDAYVAALAAGSVSATPALATATGRGLVGMLAALAPQPPLSPQPSTFGGALRDWIATSGYWPNWIGEGHLPNSAGPVKAATPATAQSILNAASDGDIVELASGTYTNITLSGKIHSPANPVTVRPAPGATVHITTPSGSGTHAWYMTNCQGFRLEGLTFDYARYCSIKLDTHVKDIELNGCSMTLYGQHDSGHGLLIGFECERIALWDCRSYNGGDHGLYLGSQGQPVSTAAFGVKGLLVANHVSYGNHKGVGASAGASAGFGIQLGDSVWGARVINCTADGNGAGAPGSGGITFYTQGSVSGEKGRDVEFINCLSTNNTGYGVEQIGTSPNAATNKVRHTLSSGNSLAQFYNFTGSLMQQVAPTWSSGDPLYANVAAGDYRPSERGAAYNVGDPAWTPAADCSGTGRVTADLGALAAFA